MSTSNYQQINMESTGLAVPHAQSDGRFNFDPTRQLLHFFEHRREFGYGEVVYAFIFILSTLPGYQPGNETTRKLLGCLDSKQPLEVNRVLAGVIGFIPMPALLRQRPLSFSDVNAFSIAQIRPANTISGVRDGQENELTIPQNAIGAMAPPTARSLHHLAHDQQVAFSVPYPAPPTTIPGEEVVYQQQVNQPTPNPVMVSYENQLLQPPFPPPAPIHGPALQIPYTSAFCTKCNANPRWKKTAIHCFDCLANKPTPEQVTAIIERARRGLGSCSNCYKPEDRGADKHCLVCHTRQVGKTQRHQAKKRAQRAQAALAAQQNVQQVGGQQAGIGGVAAAPSVSIAEATGTAGHQSGVWAGAGNYPRDGGAVPQHTWMSGARRQDYPGYGGTGTQNYSAEAQQYPGHESLGGPSCPNFWVHGAQNYNGYKGGGAGNNGIIVNNGGIVNFGGVSYPAPDPHYFATQGGDVDLGGHGVINNSMVNGVDVHKDFAFNGNFTVDGGNAASGGNMVNSANGFPRGKQ